MNPPEATEAKKTHCTHHLWDLHHTAPSTGSLHKCLRSVEQRKIPARLEPASASNCREILSCRGISTPERELQSDHSTSDWSEMLILLQHGKYFTDNWFPYPQQPVPGFPSAQHTGSALPQCLREENVPFQLELCVVLLTYPAHRWPGVLLSPRVQQEKAFSPRGRAESCTVQAKGEV